MIKPTVGRIVWFHPIGVDDVYAAIVTKVWDDNTVNLSVFFPEGYVGCAREVKLYQGQGDRPVNNYCEWMPYQLGQAAKTEALEKQIEEKRGL